MRRPNFVAALADFGFAVVALVLGWFGASLAAFALCLAAAIAAWAALRWASLRQMPLSPRLTNTALALLMIGAVLGGAYWIGLALGGHT
jgi:hypothetical protein